MDLLATIPVAAVTAVVTSLATILATHWLEVRKEKRLLRFQLAWKYRESRLDALVRTASECPPINFTMQSGELDVATLTESISDYISFMSARLFPWLNDEDRNSLETAFEPVQRWLGKVYEAEHEAARSRSPRSVGLPHDELANMQSLVATTIRGNIKELQSALESAATS